MTRRSTDPPHQPQRLPINTRPLPGETIPSYLTRLAAANHLTPAVLLRVLCRTPYLFSRSGSRDALPNHAAARSLAALTGGPLAHLRRALPALAHPWGDPLDLVPHLTPTAKDLDSGPFPACPTCLARRGIPAATIHPPAHRYVCTRHGYWLRPNPIHIGTHLPELLQAQHHHDRLARHHDSARLHHDFLQAQQIVSRWYAAGHSLGHLHHLWDQRLDILGHTGPRPHFSVFRLRTPQALRPVLYPETVTLLTLLASPHWRRHAASAPFPHVEKFYDEAGRRLHITYPKTIGAWDHLPRWVSHQRAAHFAITDNNQTRGTRPRQRSRTA